MIATQTPTVEEFLRATGDDRSEFVRGEKIEKALAGREHARIQMRLGAALEAYGQRTGKGLPFSEWHHRFGPPDDQRIYIPDIAFLLAPRHIGAPRYADSASDIMIEIVSPNDKPLDLIDKVEFYLRNGVQSVWIIDPETKQVDIQKPGRKSQRFDAASVLTDELLPGFELPLADLFAGA